MLLFTMKHIKIQIEPLQAEAAKFALERHALRGVTVKGDSLTVPAHDNATQVESLLRHAGISLFSAAYSVEGSGF